MSPEKRQNTLNNKGNLYDKEPIEPRFVITEDGRRLAYEVTGAPLDGKSRVVFLLHGLPGSRIGPKPDTASLTRMGITLVSYDRPGYGESTRKKGRTIADAAIDVKAIADDLGADTFSVIGRSGGAPHALACAALLPDRIQKVVANAPVAPPGLLSRFSEIMTDDNKKIFGSSEETIIAQYRDRAKRMSQDTLAHIYILDELITHNLRESDKYVTENPGFRNQLLLSYSEAIRQGWYGMADDAIALSKPWGFDITKIRVPVAIWSGIEDKFSPHRDSIELYQYIPGSTLEPMEERGHFAMIGDFIHILEKEIGPLEPSKIYNRSSTLTREQLELSVEIPSGVIIKRASKWNNHVAAHNVEIKGSDGDESKTLLVSTIDLRHPRIDGTPTIEIWGNPYETMVLRELQRDEPFINEDGEAIFIQEAGSAVEVPGYSIRSSTIEEANSIHKQTLEEVILNLAA